MYLFSDCGLNKGMTASSSTQHTANENTTRPAKVAIVATPEDLADAAMRRLRAEIVNKFGTVKAFAPHLSTIKYEALGDNLAGRSDMRLSVLYECLAVLEMDQAEFVKRVLADAEDPQRSK